MTTILDLIERIPSVCENILKEYPVSFDAALSKLEQPISELDELIFIGSGTSDTSARTAAPLPSPRVRGFRSKLRPYTGSLFSWCYLNVDSRVGRQGRGFPRQ